MTIDLKRTASLLFTAVFLVQAFGCSRSNEADSSSVEESHSSEENELFSSDVILDTADGFAIAVRTCDTDEFEILCDRDYDDIADEMEQMLAFWHVNPGTDEVAKVYQAIIDNLIYEIDEDSICIDEQSAEASVEVTFQLPDYEALFEDEYIHNADDFVQEASVTYAEPFVMTIEMELDDDTWRVTNYSEVFEEVYSFIGVEFDLERPVVAADQNGALDINLTSDHLDWWYDCGDDPANPVFVNLERIAAELPIEEDGADVTGISATFCAGGTVLATETDTTFVAFDAYDLPVEYCVWEEGSFDRYIAPGEYTIAFYNGDGSLIMSQDLLIEYDPGQLGYRVDFTGLYSEDDVLYVNTTEITATIMEGETCVIPAGGSVTVEYNGSTVFELDNVSTNIITFSTGTAGAPTSPNGSYLAAGEYTFTFYDYRGELFASGTCTVVVS